MFDIGFSELLLIGVVALVVIGPEKLPTVARTLGHMLGRMQRYVNDVKADINREIELDELRKFKEEVEKTASGFEKPVREEMNKTEDLLNTTARELAGDVHGVAGSGESPAAAPSASAPLPDAGATTAPKT